jgi:hypothetical protein
MEIKNVKRASLKEYSSPTGVYVAGQRCWNVDDKAQIALPCATQVRDVTTLTLLVSMCYACKGRCCLVRCVLRVVGCPHDLAHGDVC